MEILKYTVTFLLMMRYLLAISPFTRPDSNKYYHVRRTEVLREVLFTLFLIAAILVVFFNSAVQYAGLAISVLFACTVVNLVIILLIRGDDIDKYDTTERPGVEVTTITRKRFYSRGHAKFDFVVNIIAIGALSYLAFT